MLLVSDSSRGLRDTRALLSSLAWSRLRDSRLRLSPLFLLPSYTRDSLAFPSVTRGPEESSLDRASAALALRAAPVTPARPSRLSSSQGVVSQGFSEEPPFLASHRLEASSLSLVVGGETTVDGDEAAVGSGDRGRVASTKLGLLPPSLPPLLSPLSFTPSGVSTPPPAVFLLPSARSRFPDKGPTRSAFLRFLWRGEEEDEEAEEDEEQEAPPFEVGFEREPLLALPPSPSLGRVMIPSLGVPVDRSETHFPPGEEAVDGVLRPTASTALSPALADPDATTIAAAPSFLGGEPETFLPSSDGIAGATSLVRAFEGTAAEGVEEPADAPPPPPLAPIFSTSPGAHKLALPAASPVLTPSSSPLTALGLVFLGRPRPLLTTVSPPFPAAGAAAAAAAAARIFASTVLRPLRAAAVVPPTATPAAGAEAAPAAASSLEAAVEAAHARRFSRLAFTQSERSASNCIWRTASLSRETLGGQDGGGVGSATISSPTSSPSPLTPAPPPAAPSLRPPASSLGPTAVVTRALCRSSAKHRASCLSTRASRTLIRLQRTPGGGGIFLLRRTTIGVAPKC